MKQFKFLSSAEAARKDQATLKSWEDGQITTGMAIRLLCKSNKWDEEPSVNEFLDMADRLGYRRYRVRGEYR